MQTNAGVKIEYSFSAKEEEVDKFEGSAKNPEDMHTFLEHVRTILADMKLNPEFEQVEVYLENATQSLWCVQKAMEREYKVGEE